MLKSEYFRALNFEPESTICITEATYDTRGDKRLQQLLSQYASPFLSCTIHNANYTR